MVSLLKKLLKVLVKLYKFWPTGMNKTKMKKTRVELFGFRE